VRHGNGWEKVGSSGSLSLCCLGVDVYGSADVVLYLFRCVAGNVVSCCGGTSCGVRSSECEADKVVQIVCDFVSSSSVTANIRPVCLRNDDLFASSSPSLTPSLRCTSPPNTLCGTVRPGCLSASSTLTLFLFRQSAMQTRWLRTPWVRRIATDGTLSFAWHSASWPLRQRCYKGWGRGSACLHGWLQ
jgi:hypothetical protein